MQTGIPFHDAIKLIDKVDRFGNAVPFDLTFRTLQRNSKTGGRLVEYKGVKKFRSKSETPTKSNLKFQVESPAIIRRNPNHKKNRTRNLELQNGDKKKIHVRLIDSINGKKMHY